MIKAMVFELRPPYNPILLIGSRGRGGRQSPMVLSQYHRDDNDHRERSGGQRLGQGGYVHRLVDRLAVLERVAANRIIDALRISIRG